MMSRIPASPAHTPSHGASGAQSQPHGASPVQGNTHGASPVQGNTHGASPAQGNTHGASPVQGNTHGASPVQGNTHGASPAQPPASGSSSVRPPPPPGVAVGTSPPTSSGDEVRVKVPDNLRGPARPEDDFCVPSPGEWTSRSRRPRYEDASAGRAIEGLRNKPAPISGEDFEKALIDGTKDADGKAAGAEYRDLKAYVHDSWDKLSPDAKAKWRVYESKVKSCEARGLKGIPAGEYAAMTKELRETKADLRGVYRDGSAREALGALENKPGAITGDDFLRAFARGTADFDGQTFGQEFADFARFADRNWQRMTPDAKAAFLTYQSHALTAQLAGQPGAGVFDYAMLQADMRASADLVKQSLFGSGFLRI